MTSPVNKVLVTGGNGNLGKLVSDRLLDLGAEVVKFDVPGTEPEIAREGETFISGDIRNTALLAETLQKYRPDTIYHLASLLSGSSEENLEDAWEINATSSFQLIRLAVRHNVNTFFFASTVAAYGEVDEEPMPRDFEQWPGNMYGATKVAVERLGVYFKLRHGLDFRCLRYPLVISPFAPKTAVTAFPSHAFRAAVQGEKFSFPVCSESGMSAIFLDDVVQSMIDYTRADASKLSRHVYNLHAYYVSAGMIVEQLVKSYPDFRYHFEPDQVVENLFAHWPNEIEDSDARIDWGWSPKYNFVQSAVRMLEMLENS